MLMEVDEVVPGGGDQIHIGFSSAGKGKDDLISILNRGEEDYHRLESNLSPIMRTKSNEQRHS